MEVVSLKHNDGLVMEMCTQEYVKPGRLVAAKISDGSTLLFTCESTDPELMQARAEYFLRQREGR